VDREVRVTCLRGRTSDRTDGARQGAEALARALGGRVLGDASPGRPRDWSEDLPDARPVLDAAAAELSAALDQAELPVLTASDCSICIATLPTVAARVPGLRVLWIDAHGDFNSPETTPSGFLGVRELDPGEREDVDAAGVQRGVPEDGPVYVHLDVDGLDPDVMPVQFPVPGGLQLEDVREVLSKLAADGRLVGIESTALEDPGHAETVATLLPIHHATCWIPSRI